MNDVVAQVGIITATDRTLIFKKFRICQWDGTIDLKRGLIRFAHQLAQILWCIARLNFETLVSPKGKVTQCVTLWPGMCSCVHKLTKIQLTYCRAVPPLQLTQLSFNCLLHNWHCSRTAFVRIITVISLGLRVYQISNTWHCICV